MTGPYWVPRRMASLARDRRGLPVPYVNAWNPPGVDGGKDRVDDQALWHVRRDRFVDMHALFRVDEDFAALGWTPDFLRQSPQRQRQVTVAGLCQVCALPVSWQHRYLVLSSMSLNAIDVVTNPRTGRREQRLAVTEPWLCSTCGRVAVEHCPGLIRRSRDEDLHLVRVDRRSCQIITSLGYADHLPETRTRHVAMWSKIALHPDALPGDITLRVLDRTDAALAAEATQ